MKSYTRPDGFVVVPMENRRRWVVMTPDDGRPTALVGHVSMDMDAWGLYEAMTNHDEFRSASLAHALDEVVRRANTAPEES